ncbi:EPT/RTPC-like protein [Coniochaeta ligniaria NRRL 30616]|uniref:EPT/RTPC-like protein n=1 Tax=Coniochaeta ligniaria NRRL 30616 TaxID=1408157 RepID=A0A1J7IUY8_9PEZI|nr:EPT/RTPC-like protein [Coniochaeta ligniaria NRRL 30616]
MKEPKPILLDGRTGEGGGQLVRLAVSLSAVSGQPIRITHVRGNRQGGRGGGLKAQHVAAITYLAHATDAETVGLEVGSHTLEFRPRRKPSELPERVVKIEAETAAASALLVFQAVLPFLLFAGREEGEGPVEVRITGGTNVAWSLSWEYADQVLLPVLEEWFGVRVERGLVRRGWSAGGTERGECWFRVWPLGGGERLRVREGVRYGKEDFEVRWVDVSILTPRGMHEELQNAVVRGLEDLLPRAEVRFKVVEDTGKESRVYVLLVARSETLRWGRDVLTSVPKKKKKNGQGDFAEFTARKVCEELYEELEGRGTVDEFLQDQLVVFQALAEGRTSFPRSGDRDLEEELADLTIGDQIRREKAQEPFGEGSTHTKTARWVTAELLGGVEWYSKGRVCQGVGMRMEKPAQHVPMGPGT